MKHRAAIIFCCLTSFLCSYAQKPVANFQSDITGGCSPIVVNFKDLSTGNPTSWLWDFGNGAFSTKQNPSTTYFTSGTYTVTLSATNASGTGTVTKTSLITVFVEPVAEFRAIVRNGCTPAKIQFSDMSSSPQGTRITQWKWDFGDGASSSEQSPQHIYTSPGSFTVTLTVTNDKGCSYLVTKPNYIDIILGVTANFFSSEPTVCRAPALINFEANSDGPGTLSYFWDFGDGSTSRNPKLSHTYNKDGTYNVKLIVNSSQGCSDTSSGTAITIGGLVTDFTIPDICPKNEVQFLNASNRTPEFSYWRYSDGTRDTTQDPYKSFDAPGTYDVTLTNVYERCTDSVTKKVTVAPIPKLDFTATNKGSCKAPLTVQFRNLSTDAVSYKWDFGDGGTSTEANPTHTYTTAGSFHVTLVALNPSGCSDTLVKNDFVKIEKPAAPANLFTQKGCVPFVYIPHLNIVTPDSIVSYQWNFGDGGTSNEKVPNHTYTVPGTYNVTLTVTTSTGCTETFNLASAVKVGTKPKVDFTFNKTNVCASDMVQFTDNSAPSDEWNWNFGDGTFSEEKSPLHRFVNIGQLTVTLTAYNNGCADSTKKQIQIKTPVAKFEYKPDCNNRLSYVFTDRSLAPGSWTWNFGDGSPVVTTQGPILHTFPAFGVYNVSLTVSNAECSFTETRVVEVLNRTPGFTLDRTTGCKPLRVNAIPANINDKRISNYTWDFGTGSPVNTTTDAAVHTYLEAGLYQVILTTTDTFGCKDVSIAQRVRVSGPKADFSSKTNLGCKGMTTTFVDETKTDGTNPVVRWRFDFGDGTQQTFTAPPFTHVYDRVGRFTVKMVVEDAAGCADSISYRNFVRTSTFKVTMGQFSPQSCPGANTTFYSITNTRNYTSFWDLGDGTTSNQHSIVHSYSDTGTYTIRLVITDTLGCAISVVKENGLEVYRPKADFTANNFSTYCTPFEARFTNTSTFYAISLWELANGTSNQQNPVSYYTNTGVYPIKLKVFASGGCVDSVTKTLSVFNANDGEINYTPLNGGCRPFPVNFEAFSSMKANFIWDFGDGTVIDTPDNKLLYIYDNFGNFLPKVILKEPTGCLVPLMGSDTITIIGAKARFEVDRSLFCDSGMVRIADSSKSREPITNYLWDFGDGQTSDSFVPPVHYYNSPGNYQLTLMVKTESGCTDTMRLQPPVKVVQSPLISILGDNSVCLNEFNNYRGSIDRADTSALRWTWNFANGNTPSGQNPSVQKFDKPGTVTIKAVATNSSGCTTTATQDIMVNPLPVATLPATLTTQVGFPVPIPVVYGSNVVSYNWSPSIGLSCTDCPQPIAGPKYNTKYTVSYIDSNNCRNTSEIQLIVLCKNANVFVPNTFSPNGDGVNDIFYVRGKGLDRVKSLRIFNRWGEVVFEKKNFAVNEASVGWNGVYRGTRAMSGVYIYQVEVFCENSEVIRFEGNITLIQ